MPGKSASSEIIPFLRALLAKTTSCCDDLLLVQLGFEEDLDQPAKGGSDNRQRILQQHRSQSSAKDDDGRRRLQNLGELAAFQQQSGDDAAYAHDQSREAALIHGPALAHSDWRGKDRAQRRSADS